MPANNELVVDDNLALLMAIDRDQAKTLFAARGDAEVSDVVSQLSADAGAGPPQYLVSLYRTYETLRDGLRDLVARDSSPEFAAAGQAIAGGRPLYQGDEHVMTVLRPDMPPHVAAALRQVTREQVENFANLSTNATVDDLWRTLQEMIRLYDVAGNERRAVVFVATNC